MKITPLEIRKQQFEKAFRGYLPEQVDAFLSNLSSEWERIVDESKMLRMQLEIAEKEANKFRDIQSTLFKALKTAEDTAQNMLEQATLQADRNLQEAASKAEQILAEAYADAERIRTESNAEVFKLRNTTLKEMKQLERDFKELENYRSYLVVELKSLANATLENVVNFEGSFDPTILEQKFKEADQFISELPSHNLLNGNSITHDSIPTVHAYEEATEPAPKEQQPEYTHVENEVHVSTVKEEDIHQILPKSSTEEVKIPDNKGIDNLGKKVSNNIDEYSRLDDFTLIEGVSHEINEGLVSAGITTYRALSCLPPYKVHEILTQQGYKTESFDVTRWIQVALYLAKGQSEEPQTQAPKTYPSHDVTHVNHTPIPPLSASPAEPKIVPLTDSIFADKGQESTDKPKVAARVNGESLDESVDYEDRTSSIIQSLRSSMIQDGKQNGKSKEPNGQVLRLGDILNDPRRNEQTGSFFDNL